MALAYRCQSSIDEKKQESSYQKDLTKLIAKEKKHLKMLEKRLDAGVVSKLGRCVAQFERQFRTREFEEFVAEQAPHTLLPLHPSQPAHPLQPSLPHTPYTPTSPNTSVL